MALIDKASLLMVPSTYEAGTLYNVLPSGNRAPDSTDQNSGYDQTRADFTFDRGSNAAATRVNADGLIEKYRENLLTYSNDFSNASYVKINASLSQNATDYLGVANNAWTFSKSAANGQFYKQVTYSGINTFSIYAKSGSLNWLRLYVDGGGGEAFFDLQNGTIGTQSYNNIDAQIESVGNGWYRCSVSCTSVTYVNAYPADSDGVISGTSGNILISSAQVETGLVATDYLDSGATTAKAGVLIDLPRINYDANGENGALLLEPQRANGLPYSEYFNVWTAINNVSITANSTTSPEGLKNASLMSVSGAGSFARSVRQGSQSTSTDKKTMSVFAKANTANTIQLYHSGEVQGYVNFDLSSGEVGTSGTNGTGDIEPMGNDWYRCIATFDSGANFGSSVYVGFATSSSAPYGGGSISDTSLSVYIFGAQYELGSYSTSYIPNHGTSGGVTRAADTMTLSNLQVNNLLGSNQGSFVFHYKPYNAYTGSAGEIFDFRIDANNRVATYFSSGTLRLFSNIAGTTNFNQATSLDGDTEFKIALAFDTNSTLVYINGSLEYTLNGFALGLTDFDILPPANGVKLSECSFYPTKLSGAELATLTTL